VEVLKRTNHRLRLFFSEGERRSLTRIEKMFLLIIGSSLSIYQVWSVLYSKLDAINQMAIHLSFILVLTFFLYSFSKQIAQSRVQAVINYLFIGLAISAGTYYFIHAERIALRTVGVDGLTTLDIVFGLTFVLLVMEAARRTIGFSIVAVALVFIIYSLYGHLLEGTWYHYEMSPAEVLDHLAFSFNGLWGSPISVAASFVFIFVLFGAFLQRSGASEFFFKLSIAIAGRTRGGAAKIAIIASAFFGTISGSPTANVVTTGPFTIPLAMKLGYSRRFAAAVEAIASTGGSLLPPIMGSSAFLMAAVTGLPYGTIAIAALLPGILFYVSLFSVVHLEAIRLDLPRASEGEIPKVKDVLRSGSYHFLPVIMLVVFLFQGYSPSRTGVYGIITIVVLSWLTKKNRMGVQTILKSLTSGAQSAIPISTACATAGLVIAGIMSTGLGGKLNSIILSMTAGYLIPSLIIIMVMCIILGMGMPVAAAYVLTAMLAAPTLISLDISPLAAHLFIVYFSIISAITPPVAVASFAAAGIADVNPTKVSFEAVRLSLTSYIIPFIFVLNEALIMNGTILQIIYAFMMTTIGIIVISSSLIGYLYRELNAGYRLLLFFCGICIAAPYVYLNVASIVCVAFVVLVEHRSHLLKKNKPLNEVV